jgi:hypothetical protein
MNFKNLNNAVGWIVFLVAAAVYFYSAEPTVSLWDCGEFISAAHKLQVVHPPGAPLFLMIGRLFAWTAELVSDQPSDIARAVNFLSGISGAFNALFIFWITTMLAKMALVGRREMTDQGDIIATLGAGVVAGLSCTFITSVWFSAVEGEVYAMSGMFTALIVWAMMRWYTAPETPYVDRWLMFVAFVLGLSSTVHLLSLLAIPVLTMLYAMKRHRAADFLSSGEGGDMASLQALFVSILAGVFLLGFFQYFVIPVVPTIGAWFDYSFTNSGGLPAGTGLLFFVLLLGALIGSVVRYANDHNKPWLQKAALGFGLVMLGFSTYTMILVRANANTPLNMNDPSDPFTFVSYLKREQYGDRPLFYGPHFNSEPTGYKAKNNAYQPIDGKYQLTKRSFDYEYASKDMMLLPRLGHSEDHQKRGYQQWIDYDPKGNPDFGNNLSFLFRYQIGWMYFRYFAWNFIGRQNGEQGFGNDPTSGNWISGVAPIDNARLYDMSNMTQDMAEDPSRNTYYFLPFLLGMIGMIYHFYKRPSEAGMVMLLFLMTGLAIVFYANEPPREPRERDYSYAGSFFTFTIWLGMGVIGLYKVLKLIVPSTAAAAVVSALTVLVPIQMGVENWDDHSRATHWAARDYAANFLNSVAPNAVIFTYGDNDTYPLWYCQEVEGIRRDVRVVNFSLLGVDWYIDQLRRKINDSPAIAMSLDSASYRGSMGDYVMLGVPKDDNVVMPALSAIAKVNKETGGKYSQLLQRTEPPFYEPIQLPTRNFVVPIDSAAVRRDSTLADIPDSLLLKEFRFTFGNTYWETPGAKLKDVGRDAMYKDMLAVLDIVANNINSRPIYFAVTVREDKIAGLRDYLRLEGLGLRIVPMRTRSSPTFPGVMGYGDVDADRCYDIIMNKWKWGNFDDENHRTFVDRSYGPSVSSMQLIMLRTAEALAQKGQKDKAVALLKKFFDVFPNNNFPWDKNFAEYALKQMLDAGAVEEAKPYLSAFAAVLQENLDFYASLGDVTALDYPSLSGQYAKLKGFIKDPAQAKEIEMEMSQKSMAYRDLLNSDLVYFKDDAGRILRSIQTLRQDLGDPSVPEETRKLFFDPLSAYVQPTQFELFVDTLMKNNTPPPPPGK